MIKRQQPVSDKNNEMFRDDTLHPVTKPLANKISNLTPYLAQIQKRKRFKNQLQRSKKNVNNSSSKSFRIKDKSVTSLQKQLLNRRETREAPALKKQHTPSQYLEHRPSRQRRTQSVNRHQEIEFSKTIEQKEAPTSNNFFNELYSKVRNRVESTNKERKGVRRGQYETIDGHRTRSQQAGELSMYKISFTNGVTQNHASSAELKELQAKKAVAPVKRNNFRRNKYQAASQEVERKETIKDTNTLSANLNLQMDRLAARQNQSFLLARNRQFYGSVQKSTEKYFNSQSYRPIRSKNQIQLYISTVPNPALHKASKSTNEKSQCQNKLLASSLSPKKTTDLLEYDFDFKNEEDLMPQEQYEQSEPNIVTMKENDNFQRQRNKVELDFFNKGQVHLDWSEDDCKIDDI